MTKAQRSTHRAVDTLLRPALARPLSLMISWIQRSFQQHFRVIFAVLLGVTIISFIFTIGASPGIGRAGPKTLKQRFFGHDLTQQGASEQLYGDASLSVHSQVGFSAMADIASAQLQQYAFQRTAALALADQLKIPAPSREELSAHIRGLRAFAGSDGQFDPSRYAAMRDSLKTDPRLSEGDLARVFSDDVRIARVQQLLAGPGYVLAGEVRDQLARSDSSWTIAVATAEYASFKPEISVSEDALKKFFEDSAFRYEVPPRVAVDYVEFPADNYLSAVTVSDADVRAYYDQNRSRFPKPEEKKTDGDKKTATPDVATHNPDADFAAVRPKVEQALKTERAMRLAAKAAADLTVALYDQRLKPHTPAFDGFLAKSRLTPRPVAPFYRDNVPSDLGWTPQIVDQVLQLTADRPVSDPLPSANGSVVLFWRETLPSYRPELAQVRERALAEYKENDRRRRFVEFGRTTRTQIEARLKSGDSFDKAAAADAQLKLDVKSYPAFIRRQPPKDIEPAVLSALERLQSGQVSDMVLAEDKGFFVYVKEKKLPDMAETSPQYAATRAQLAQLEAGLDQSLALSEIVSRELKRSAPDTGR